jgi:hypothetical protein
MKTKLGVFCFSILLLLGVAVPVLAQQRRLVEEGCRQGSCWATYFLSKRLIHQNQLGGQNSKLYEVSLEVNSDYDGTKSRTQWVYCSLDKPFVAFDFPEEDDEFVYFHYLSPANSLEIGGYNSGSYSLYWAICHDRFIVDPFALTSTARQMGYNEVKVHSPPGRQPCLSGLS